MEGRRRGMLGDKVDDLPSDPGQLVLSSPGVRRVEETVSKSIEIAHGSDSSLSDSPDPTPMEVWSEASNLPPPGGSTVPIVAGTLVGSTAGQDEHMELRSRQVPKTTDLGARSKTRVAKPGEGSKVGDGGRLPAIARLALAQDPQDASTSRAPPPGNGQVMELAVSPTSTEFESQVGEAIQLAPGDIGGIPVSRRARPAVRRILPEPTAAPIRARNLGDQPPNFWHGGKIGDHSVRPTDVTPIQLLDEPLNSQNVFRSIYQAILVDPNRITVRDQGIYVRNLTQMPLQGRMPIQVFHEARFCRGDRRPAVRNMVVEFDQPLEIGTVSPSSRKEFITDELIDFRKFTNVFRSTMNVTVPLQAAMTHLLTRDYGLYDLSAVFTIGWYLYDYALWCERWNYERAPGQVLANSLTIVNLRAQGNDEAAAVQRAVTAVETGRISLFHYETSAATLNVCLAISLGANAWVINENNLIHRYFQFPNICWTLYTDVAYEPGAFRVPTSAEIRAALNSLAQQHEAINDLVAGMTRWAVMATGALSDDSTWFSATFEVERLRIPQPRSRLFLWRMIRALYERDYAVNLLETEYALVMSIVPDDWLRVLTGAGCLISIACSTIFLHYNLGGRELTTFASHRQETVGTFLQTAFSAEEGRLLPKFLGQALSLIPQITTCNIFWMGLATPYWCGGFYHRRLDDGVLWEGVWNRTIPFHCRLESMIWLYTSFCSDWGLSGPNPVVDVSSELFRYGGPANSGLMIWMGDRHYSDLASSNFSYTYNAYGLHFVNALKPHLQSREDWLVSYRMIRRSRAGTAMVDPAYVIDADIQPEYDENLMYIITGTLPTYDWRGNAIMAPSVLQGAIGDQAWGMLTTINGEQIMRSGLALNFSRVVEDIAVFPFDFASTYTNRRRAVPAVSDRPKDAEMREN